MEDEAEVVRNLVLSVCDLVQHGSAPSARAGAAVATHNGRLFLFGGADENKVYADLFVLEFEQMLWVELTPQGTGPCARWGHSLCGFEDKLVIFGGAKGEPSAPQPTALSDVPFKHTGPALNDLVFAQVATNEWTTPTTSGTPPSPRVFHSATVVGQHLVVVGGAPSLAVEGGALAQPLGDVHVLDLKSLAWSCPVTAGTPRAAHKACAVGSSVVVFGGSNDASVDQLDCQSWGWKPVRTVGTAPAARRFHSFDLVGGSRIFAFAGQASTEAADLYVLDTDSWRWQKPLYEGQLNVRGHAAAVLTDKLLIFGGLRSSRKKEEAAKLSKKLFFLNVLEIREGSTDATMKFKLVTVGDSGVGKSCLLTRFVQDVYTDTHVSTIGVDFKTVISMVKGRLVKLQLWDTAGQERFSVVTGNYYRNADGFIFVFDATNRQSFEHIEQWQAQVLQHHDCGPSTIKILVGNKFDLKDQVVVSDAEAEEKAVKLGATFFAVSAKNALNVDMAFLSTAQSLVDMRRQTAQQQPKSVQLARPGGAQPGAGGGGAQGGCPGGGGRCPMG